MNGLLPVSLLSLTVLCVAATTAFAGVEVVRVPEPTSLALLASGMGLVYIVRKARRR